MPPSRAGWPEDWLRSAIFLALKLASFRRTVSARPSPEYALSGDFTDATLALALFCSISRSESPRIGFVSQRRFQKMASFASCDASSREDNQIAKEHRADNAPGYHRGLGRFRSTDFNRPKSLRTNIAFDSTDRNNAIPARPTRLWHAVHRRRLRSERRHSLVHGRYSRNSYGLFFFGAMMPTNNRPSVNQGSPPPFFPLSNLWNSSMI